MIMCLNIVFNWGITKQNLMLMAIFVQDEQKCGKGFTEKYS